MGKNDQTGFTLVEIIVTLVLVGILASIAGMGIVQATRSYLFSRDASAMAQKAQAAYARMGRTFLNMADIDVAGGSTPSRLRVTIERNHANVVETYEFIGTTLTLQIGGNTDLLLDNLTNASGFSYFQNDGTAWTSSNDTTDLSRIQVNIAMDSPGGQAVGFSGTFVPRNIYRPEQIIGFMNGETAMPSGGCFISTALHEKTGKNFVLYLLAGGGILILISAGRRGKMKGVKSDQRGSVLIGVIITILVMGILAAAMTSMFSSSSVGTVTPSLSNSAYYAAESAYRYVLYTFLNTAEGSRYQSLRDNVDGKNMILEGNKEAVIDMEAFWFTADGGQSGTTLQVESPINFPSEYLNPVLTGSGYLDIEGRDDNPVRYTGVVYNAGGSFTFTLAASRTVLDGDVVFPAFLNTSMTGTISEGGNISVSGGGSLAAFPWKNGVIALSTNSGGGYVLLYERRSGSQLINVTSAANLSALPSGGLQNYGGIDHISLLQNMRITVTGSSGDASSPFHAERKIEYYQPMMEGIIATKHEFQDNLDNLDNWKTGGDDQIGGHAIVGVDDDGVESNDGDNAIAVTDTESINGPVSGIRAAYYGKEVQESLLLYKPDTAGFEDIWDRSEEKLSYEVQVKVAFTGSTDNADNNPQGTYMPGIVFRARESETFNNVREYYGLSFVRGLFAKDGNDNPLVSDPDADDIPDEYLFENHGQAASLSGAADDVCISDYTPGPRWYDTPPMSGVPYMMLWQQAFDFDEWDGVWQANSDLYVNWLSYVPLCKVTEVTIYHYHAGVTPVPDTVPCQPCAACTTKSWRKYWWDSPLGWGWYPDCCTSRIQTDSGGWLNPWRDYDCNSYDCTGGCYDAGCCGTPVSYPEGWYLSSNGNPPFPSSDPRSYTRYTAYRLEDHQEYGLILQHENINVNGQSVDIIGNINNTINLIRDPDTFDQAAGYRGDPIENAAFIFPIGTTVAFQRAHNYRVYLKPWVTIMARIIEMKGDFFDETGNSNCGNSEEERVNVIQAWFGEPSTYPRGQFRWPDESPASFSEMIWPDKGYTSKTDQFTVGSGWGSSERFRRLCDRGEDQYTNTDEKRSPYVYTNQLTSDGYDNYSADNQPAELGLHTFGIDATSSDPEHRDRVYFDDFSVRVFEYGKATGLLPGVQNE